MELNLYTAHSRHQKYVMAMGMVPIDVSDKTPIPDFKPSRELKRLLKDGQISEARYTELYREELLERAKAKAPFFRELIRRKHLVVCCDRNAQKSQLCNRLVVREVIRELCAGEQGVDFVYHGEIL